MDDRIQQYLDGHRAVDELTDAERLEAERLQALFAHVPDPAGVDGATLPDLAPGVLARIAAIEGRSEIPDTGQGGAEVAPITDRGAMRRFGQWIWAPRQVSLRPGFALGLAAALALVMVPVVRSSAPTGPGIVDPAGGSGASAEVFVHFRLDAPGAASVRLVGDFTEWEPSLELHEVSPGVWTAMVGLQPGIHDYAFVVDGGEWVTDPLALEVDDGFGGTSSRLSILPPENVGAEEAAPRTL